MIMKQIKIKQKESTMEQLKDCLNLIVQAERDLAAAKEEYKTITDSSFDAIDLSKDQRKAMKKVAKAMLNNKVNSVDGEATALAEVLGMVMK